MPFVPFSFAAESDLDQVHNARQLGNKHLNLQNAASNKIHPISIYAAIEFDKQSSPTLFKTEQQRDVMI